MRILILIVFLMSISYSQPPIEPGVSHELAKWRAAHYSDVRYKLNLTLEKMSPVLKGTIEIRVNVRDAANAGRGDAVIILDWRKIRGHEEKSTISNVSINGRVLSPAFTRPTTATPSAASNEGPPEGGTQNTFEESNEHLIFRDGVVLGENVIKLDFTSPILTSGSAITRYVDKEDGSEYIYSLFVPSDASTAFPVFDQPDLKARFSLSVRTPTGWEVITNTPMSGLFLEDGGHCVECGVRNPVFSETKPISTYVFAFAAGPWLRMLGNGSHRSEPRAVATGSPVSLRTTRGNPVATAQGSDLSTHVYVRKSQLAKFQPHAAEVFRLNREGIKFLESYFDYKFPFPKYDLVLIPEFPFGGMEHAGATFLRESSVIFPQEPTKNDYISRANLIFHEAAHQWFGDTVTMKWFDDLWLKEGFAEFMAYKTLEKVMPEYNAWKVFYERNKQAAYLTDLTRGTTPIYQEIANLSAAKSAYGNIVYRKAPSFLKQAEFYIGADKFQTAVRAFLKKHEFANAGWKDLVKEFERQKVTGARRVLKNVEDFADIWVTRRGMKKIETSFGWDGSPRDMPYRLRQSSTTDFPGMDRLSMEFECLVIYADGTRGVEKVDLRWPISSIDIEHALQKRPLAIIPNYQDYGYGIFLLDDKSRDYVLKNIQNEKDDFLRSMMWGALWDSVREAELDPKEYVELVLRVLSPALRRPNATEKPPEGGTQNAEDETTVASLFNRVSTAMTYYLSDKQRDEIAPRLESMLIEKMRTASTLGQRITFYRALLNVASTEKARGVLKEMLRQQSVPPAVAGGSTRAKNPPATAGGTDPGMSIPLKTKDRFDIVTELAFLNDPDAEKLLADLEKTETSDDAKRYAYAARAAFPRREVKEKYWNDFVNNKDISESWIEAALGPFNSVRQADLTLPYLERALKELPNHKRNRKIFFVNGWLAAFIGGQRSEEALNIVNKFLADNPNLDRDLRLKILENVDVIERAVKIRAKFAAR